MNILVVDSSVLIIERLKNIIEQENNSVIVFGTTYFENALHIIKENKPAVIILYMNLPGNRVIDLIKAIKKESGYQTFIIVLFIQIDATLKEQCQSLGADVLLDKFLEFDKIPGIIHTLQRIKKLNTQT